ncbi:hypothetical protein Plhal304r1_c021g0074731 [Plasmopara halstedii]
MWTAEYTWNCYVHPICSNVKVRLQHNALGSSLKEISIGLASAYQLTPTATKLFRISAIQVVLNITRCCALRALWLHRKKSFTALK